MEGLYRGLTECLHPYDTPILGGDICRSPTITIAITAFGHVDPQRVLRRSTAQVGDAIVVTGPHGGSRAGLELLLRPEWGLYLDGSTQAALIRAHQRPRPRLDVLPLLPPIRIAAMDSSDGLADAVLQLCRASQVGAQIRGDCIQGDCIPWGAGLAVGAPGPEKNLPLEWILYGGEDFELVLCLDPVAAEGLVAQLGSGAAVIGEITSGSEVLLLPPSSADPIALSLAQGFQHFGAS